jgi:hypothetical protein
MFVKPAPGRKVRSPLSKQHIPETGVEVPDTDTYWVRRLQDGDVVEVKPVPDVAKASSPKGKE